VLAEQVFADQRDAQGRVTTEGFVSFVRRAHMAAVSMPPTTSANAAKGTPPPILDIDVARQIRAAVEEANPVLDLSDPTVIFQGGGFVKAGPF
jgi:hypothetical protein